MKEKKVTIREVAALAGVSISSVSRYLKDPKSVQPLAAYNIKNAIRELEYEPNIFAQNLKRGRSNVCLLYTSMVIALGVAHSTEAAKAQREVTDMTNALLQKNAQTLKMATIEAAKESERGIVDIETLQKTNESLISTFDEVMNIQREGREKRRAVEAEMYRLEGELKQKLLQINH